MSWIQNNEDDGDDIINNDALRQLRRSPLQTNLNIDFDSETDTETDMDDSDDDDESLPEPGSEPAPSYRRSPRIIYDDDDDSESESEDSDINSDEYDYDDDISIDSRNPDLYDIGNIGAGILNDDEIDFQLPARTIRIIEDNPNECSICSLSYNDNKLSYICGHTICMDCNSRWPFQCPKCRQSLSFGSER